MYSMKMFWKKIYLISLVSIASFLSYNNAFPEQSQNLAADFKSAEITNDGTYTTLTFDMLVSNIGESDLTSIKLQNISSDRLTITNFSPVEFGDIASNNVNLASVNITFPSGMVEIIKSSTLSIEVVYTNASGNHIVETLQNDQNLIQ